MYVETDLAITGKPAQFGRGALAEVSAALIDRFSANLAGELAAAAPHTADSGDTVPDAPAEAVDGSAGASAAPPPVTVVVEASAPSANGQAPPTTSRPAAEPLDLMDLAGAGVLKRVAPYAAGAAALLLVALGLRGRRRPRAVEVVVVRCCDHAATGAVRHAVDQAITRAR
ncbi:MAG: hypothetical protein HOV68_08475 [Streptomycetaceae bacterium]|nr:hypothetical protein [Streptomycetaceae bacterium]